MPIMTNIVYDSDNQPCKRVFGELVPYDPDNCNYTKEGIEKLLQMKYEREDIIEASPFINTDDLDIDTAKEELDVIEEELRFADFYNEYLEFMGNETTEKKKNKSIEKE